MVCKNEAFSDWNDVTNAPVNIAMDFSLCLRTAMANFCLLLILTTNIANWIKADVLLPNESQSD
jgi:hypothetical protein